MTQKLLRRSLAGLIGYALIAPVGGCDGVSQSPPTIDTSTPLKAPAAPTVHKVDIKAGAKGAKK